MKFSKFVALTTMVLSTALTFPSSASTEGTQNSAWEEHIQEDLTESSSVEWDEGNEDVQEPQIVAKNGNQIPGTSIGSFRLTGYCPCSSCSDGYGRQTASGKTATAGRTIAVDKKVIPLGTHVWINLPESGWHEFIAEDVGGGIKGNRIDIFKNTHKACFANDCNGYAEVRIVRS